MSLETEAGYLLSDQSEVLTPRTWHKGARLASNGSASHHLRGFNSLSILFDSSFTTMALAWGRMGQLS